MNLYHRGENFYYEHYTPILDSLYHGEDVVYACRMVCGELKKRELYYFTELIIPHMDGEFLYHIVLAIVENHVI